MQLSRARAGHAEATGIRRINAQTKAKVEEREDPKEDMARRGSRHHRPQESQDPLEEGRITKEASTARQKERQAKARERGRAGYAMDPTCSEIAQKVDKEVEAKEVRPLSSTAMARAVSEL